MTSKAPMNSNWGRGGNSSSWIDSPRGAYSNHDLFAAVTAEKGDAGLNALVRPQGGTTGSHLLEYDDGK
jgi:hypothetical protein